MATIQFERTANGSARSKWSYQTESTFVAAPKDIVISPLGPLSIKVKGPGIQLQFKTSEISTIGGVAFAGTREQALAALADVYAK